MWSFPFTAGVVSAVFAAMLARAWFARRRPNLAAWSIALSLFAIASFAVALGVLLGWSPALYRVYYLAGAIVNVPVLALGTVYLFASRRIGHACSAAVVVASLVATWFVLQADIATAPLASRGIPPGSEVMPESTRTLSRYYSFVGFFVVVGGALFSAWRGARSRREQLRRFAFANLLIAAGTFVVAVASGFARYGRGSVFAVGLLVGVTVMFGGFLATRPR